MAKKKVGEIKKQKQKPIDIIFCVPGSHTSMVWVWAWTDMIVKCLQNNLKIAFFTRYNCNIYYVRSMCLGGNNQFSPTQKPFNGKIDYKYICWIDTDTIPSFEGIQRLIKQDAEVVSGIYKMANNRDFATVVKMDYDYYNKNNSMFKFLTLQEVNNFYEMNKNSKNIKDFLIEVDYTGMGFMLVKHGVFEKLRFPWFRPVDFKVQSGVIDFFSEDSSLCYRLKEKGIKIHVDLGVRCGHMKEMIL